METKTAMHPEEKLLRDALDALNSGNEELHFQLRSQMLLSASSLKWLVKVRGKNIIKEWNLKTDNAEKEYGKDWLNRFN